MKSGLTVGQFAQVTHLSVKALRHYHDVGLLIPTSIDPDTGYRYYRLDQVPSAQVIRRLRDLDMPVADVKAVLAAGDTAQRNALISAHLRRLEDRLDQTQRVVSSLRALLDPMTPDTAIEHRTVPATRAIGIQEMVGRDDAFAWFQGAFGELHAIASAQRLRITGTSGGIFSTALLQDDFGDATVFMPVQDTGRPVGRVTPLVVPAAELAIAVHRGPLSEIDRTYSALGMHTTRYEIGVDAPLREYYVTDPRNSLADNDWVTEVGWPIFRADNPTLTRGETPTRSRRQGYDRGQA
jgi:DNA-binding transcriptional MerR regulator